VDARGGARDADLARVAGVAAEARALREAAEERRAALRCRRALARAARCPPRARLAPSPAQEPPLPPPRAPCPEPGAEAGPSPTQEPPLRLSAPRCGARGAARPARLTSARVRGFLAELRGADGHLWLDPGDAAAAQQALTPLAQERLASLSRALAQVCRTRGAPDPARFCSCALLCMENSFVCRFTAQRRREPRPALPRLAAEPHGSWRRPRRWRAQ
jgi:hypothetical protein